MTVSVLVLETPLAVAVITAELGAATLIVRTLKVLLEVPAATMALDAGTATPVLELESVTMMLAGVLHSKITVPVTGLGPTTGFGLKLTACTPMRRTVSEAVFVTVPSLAVTLPT